KARVVVTFSPPIPTTGLDDVVLEISPQASGFTSLFGSPLKPQAQVRGVPPVSGGIPRDQVLSPLGPNHKAATLIDKAPPVLLAVTPLDLDGDGGLDQVIFQ